MTASWLRQMGWRDVFVLAEKGYETGVPTSPILGTPPPLELRIDAGELARLHARNETTIFDLSLSREYRPSAGKNPAPRDIGSHLRGRHGRGTGGARGSPARFRSRALARRRQRR